MKISKKQDPLCSFSQNDDPDCPEYSYEKLLEMYENTKGRETPLDRVRKRNKERKKEEDGALI